MSFIGRLIRSVQEAETARKKRALTGSWELVFKIIATIYSLFLIYTAVSGQFSSSVIRETRSAARRSGDRLGSR